ncbi:MAG: glycosyltransferase [Gammaproteobacteria bacterium]|nr:glycosyltransferase [Gammaproteobacteria bacterium]
MTDPLLSLCMPTGDRADLLAYTLERLCALQQFGVPFEIVVADNMSSDHTAQVVAERARVAPFVRYCRHPYAASLAGGIINAVHNARGKYVVVHADDDFIVPQALFGYVERLEREPDLVAIYADWMAYDDEADKELYRYFVGLSEPVVFGPDVPVALVEFVLRHVLFPEQAVFRKDVLLRCQELIRRGAYFYHLWMYRVSRYGRVAFELEPFYREHAVIKPEYRRGERANWSMRLHVIGDEMRNQLESIVLAALQDSGATKVPVTKLAELRGLIDHFLHARLDLEIARAKHARDWLLALELRRRQVLWHGLRPQRQQHRDVTELALPAALQHIRELTHTLSDVVGVRLQGFRERTIHNLFRTHFPDVTVLEGDENASAPAEGRALVVDKLDWATPDYMYAEQAGYRISLQRLLDLNRVGTVNVDLSEL